MPDSSENTYVIKGGPKEYPVLGAFLTARRNPLGFLTDNGRLYGDVIPFKVLGRSVVQVNHPDLVRYVLMENNKNYRKSRPYIRFESAIGQGLLTSNGEKWRRDRQKIQPMFKREQMEGFYFSVINEVSEKYKKRWLDLTQNGPVDIDITHEMACITLDIIATIVFGRDMLDSATMDRLHGSYRMFMDYLAKNRIFPRVDIEKIFRTQRYRRFKKEVDDVYALFGECIDKYRNRHGTEEKFNMLALLIEAQKLDPHNFSDQDICEHAVSMIFAGFETTSNLMQWMWYTLDTHSEEEAKLRASITTCAPCTATADSSGMTYAELEKMDYLTMAVRETMRLHPPFWLVGREPIEDDVIGGLPVKKDTIILLPQIVMHRHVRWWDEPDEFIPERFLPECEAKMNDGVYFPFSQGPRKCSGYKLAEMEAKAVFAKLLPLFKVTALNREGNGYLPTISLKLAHSLQVRISRS